jgi:hypothetical protein
MVTIDKALFKLVKRGKRPMGYVAAVDAGLVGWSLFNYSDEPRKFNKQRSKEIAYGRAVKTFRRHKRAQENLSNPIAEVPHSMLRDFVEMDTRSKKYFKQVAK